MSTRNRTRGYDLLAEKITQKVDNELNRQGITSSGLGRKLYIPMRFTPGTASSFINNMRTGYTSFHLPNPQIRRAKKREKSLARLSILFAELGIGANDELVDWIKDYYQREHQMKFECPPAETYLTRVLGERKERDLQTMIRGLKTDERKEVEKFIDGIYQRK